MKKLNSRKIQNGAKAKEKTKDKLPEYTSSAALSQATGIPLDILKAARRAGCDAFHRSGRVRLEPLLRWIFSTDREENQKMNWGALLEEYKAKREKIKFDKEDGQSIDRSIVSFGIQGIMTAVFGVLERALLSELPPLAKGKSETDIAALGKTYLETIREEFQIKFEAMKTEGVKSED